MKTCISSKEVANINLIHKIQNIGRMQRLQYKILSIKLGFFRNFGIKIE
ncbi:MAG: hypothetical protein LBD84_06955 [Campylobacteraceae bacterium]|jgi:hypothetical protein|nr:hypothetical protein [Campylobacteraceae bacterium]